MYDYSLLEKYVNVDYKIKVFNLRDKEEAKELADIILESRRKNKVGIILRKDFYAEKIGEVLCHLEWFTYEKEAVSPFAATDKVKPVMINKLENAK